MNMRDKIEAEKQKLNEDTKSFKEAFNDFISSSEPNTIGLTLAKLASRKRKKISDTLDISLTTLSHLLNGLTVPQSQAVKLEIVTGISRKTMYPKEWYKMYPELAETAEEKRLVSNMKKELLERYNKIDKESK